MRKWDPDDDRYDSGSGWLVVALFIAAALLAAVYIILEVTAIL